MRYGLFVFSLLTGLLFLVQPFQSVSAITGSEFRAGNIIDDGVFFNGNTLSALDIQGFLNAKVPNCDVWGSQTTSHPNGSGGYYTRAQWGALNGNPAPYTCLKGYQENTPVKGGESALCAGFSGGVKSAAQIIYEVGQSCGVSQKVLIVLLEKEQSLVTDDWPWSNQYRSATGYGCPDTAPCDQEYYGFFNQVYNAARQFKRYARDQTLFSYRAGRVSYIQYNPNSGCGGTNVLIENQATASLYNYTPYQPNPAALTNLRGTGDGCSAYGNRNFWVLFNDWFGSTRYAFGFKPSSSSVYASLPCTIPNFDSTWVGRLYNPDSQDFLYTTNYIEACQAVRYGYIWDDTVMKNASGANIVPVYRLANYRGHFYTPDTNLRSDYLTNRGYRDEGIGFYAYANSLPGTIAVTQLTNGYTTILTSAGKEAEFYRSYLGFSNSAVFYTPALDAGEYPIARLGRNNQRLYTADQTEKSAALTRYGFSDEGTISYNDLRPNEINMPVYRLRSPVGAYFYTTNRTERDAAVINYDYVSEGIAFYALMYSDKPIYRASNYQNGLKIFTNSQLEYDVAGQRYQFTKEGIGWYSY